MPEFKKRVIIIGNGFDLAHGYKTKYSDFLNHLLLTELEVFRKGVKLGLPSSEGYGAEFSFPNTN